MSMVDHVRVNLHSSRKLAELLFKNISTVRGNNLTDLEMECRSQRTRIAPVISFSTDAAEREVKMAEANLRRTLSVNNVTLNASETYAQNAHGVRVRTISGCAGLITFSLEIKIQECSEDSPLRRASIEELNLTVFKGEEELERFVDRMRECRDVIMCIKGLENYAVSHTLRRNTFANFKRDRPDFVSFDPDENEKEIKIFNPNKGGVRATIAWRILVEGTGRVSSDIALTVQKQHWVALLDDDDLISKLPSVFQFTKELYGVERALSVVIDLLQF